MKKIINKLIKYFCKHQEQIIIGYHKIYNDNLLYCPDCKSMWIRHNRSSYDEEVKIKELDLSMWEINYKRLFILDEIDLINDFNKVKRN